MNSKTELQQGWAQSWLDNRDNPHDPRTADRFAEEHHGWFLTSTGRRFVPQLPAASKIDIEDIAHALSQLCRFGGHCCEFYSVAQHSVIVSLNVPPEHRFAALMHDAAEAYLGDVIQPIKRLLPEYKAMESEVWRAL